VKGVDQVWRVLYYAYYIPMTCTATVDRLIDCGNVSRRGEGGSMRPYRQNSTVCIIFFYWIPLDIHCTSPTQEINADLHCMLPEDISIWHRIIVNRLIAR